MVSHTQSEYLPSKEYGGDVISLVSAPWAPQTKLTSPNKAARQIG